MTIAKVSYPVYWRLCGTEEWYLEGIFETHDEARDCALRDKLEWAQDHEYKITIRIENDLELI